MQRERERWVSDTVTTGESLNITDAYEDERFNKEPIDACFSSAGVLLLNKMTEETAPSLQNKFMESALRIDIISRI